MKGSVPNLRLIEKGLIAANARLLDERKLLIECHSVGVTGRRKDVRDRRGKAAIKAMDEVIEDVAVALKEFRKL